MVFQYVAAFKRNIIDEYCRELGKNLEFALIDSFQALNPEGESKAKPTPVPVRFTVELLGAITNQCDALEAI